MWLWVENRFVILIIRLTLRISSSSLDVLAYSCSVCFPGICMHVQSPLHLVSKVFRDPPASWLKPKCHLLEASKYCIAPTEGHLVIFLFLTWGVRFDRMSIMHISSSFIRLLVWVKRKLSATASWTEEQWIAPQTPLFFSSPFFEWAALKQADTWPYFCKGFASPRGLFAFTGISLHTLPSCEISARSEIPYEMYNVQPAIKAH